MNVRLWVCAKMAEMLARMPGTSVMRGYSVQSSLKMSEEVPRIKPGDFSCLFETIKGKVWYQGYRSWFRRLLWWESHLRVMFRGTSSA